MVRSAGTGKKKIPIKRIKKESNRKVTFTKRWKELLKKARALEIIIKCKVAIICLSTPRNPNTCDFGDFSLLESFCGDARNVGGGGSGYEGGDSGAECGASNCVGDVDVSIFGDVGNISSSGGGLVTNSELLSLFHFDDVDESGGCSTRDGVGLMNWSESSNLGGSESSRLDGYESCDLGESMSVGNLTGCGGGGLKSGGGELGMLDWSESLNFEDVGMDFNQLMVMKERLLAAMEGVIERLNEAEETELMVSELLSDDTFFLKA